MAVVAAIVATPATLGAPRVVGGSPADVRNAPWSVVVVHGTLQTSALCSGSIIDALHVLTAGHCVVNDDGTIANAHTFIVRAGVTNAITPTATDHLQDRTVASIRLHPGYHYGTRAEEDDVAVVTLASPLDLSGANAQAIALPGPGLRLTNGQAVSLAGFGVTAAGGSPDVALNRMSSTLISDAECLGPPDDLAGAVLVCAFSGTNSPCHGDSGSALVLMTPTPVAVGVTGAGTCDANTAAEFADLTAPEILQFVQGNDNPPLAPRMVSAPTVTGPTRVPQVGQTLRCEPGTWTEAPAIAYGFLEGTNHLVLRTGPSSYTLRIGDAGRSILCRVTATSAGGASTSDSRPTAEVSNPPDLAVPTARARPGRTAVIEVRLVSWSRPVGTITVCATAGPRVGGRVCRTAAAAGSSVALRFPVKATAPAGYARVSVTARAADGRSAAASGLVAVR